MQVTAARSMTIPVAPWRSSRMEMSRAKGAPEQYGRWSFSCERAAIKRLDRAFQAFFRRCAAGEKPGYPRFKGRGWWGSVQWPDHGHGCKWDSVPHPTVTRVYLQGVGHVRVHQHRAVRGRVKTITARREGRRWYVILSCDDVPAEPLEPTGAAVGIDMGVASFLTTSNGARRPTMPPESGSHHGAAESPGPQHLPCVIGHAR
ncbi:MAG: family transposase OrfB [Actinomycetia bacterium]|nr:family transposase OrfB [Actinomycetes bacterium]